MKIIYENLKNSNYIIGNDEVYDFFFRSLNTISDMNIEPIILYDSSIFSSDKIYLELANAITPKLALNFCNKYGTLYPPNNKLSDIYSYIENFDDFKQERLYDYFLYNHFQFYRFTMYSLLNIYGILQKDIFSPDDLFQLFKHSISSISNPFYNIYFPILFDDITDDIDEALDIISDNYPLMKFIHLLSIDYQEEPLLLYQSPSVSILLEKISSFPNKHFSEFIKLSLSKFDPIYKLTVPHISDLPFNVQEYFKIHKKDCINFAKYVFSQILSFLIKDCVPVVDFSSFDNISSWKFTSLADAIFFYFHMDCSNGNKYKVCANEYCQQLFACSPAYSKKIYCSNTCAHKVANRKYKNKHKNKN